MASPVITRGSPLDHLRWSLYQSYRELVERKTIPAWLDADALPAARALRHLLLDLGLTADERMEAAPLVPRRARCVKCNGIGCPNCDGSGVDPDFDVEVKP